MKFYSLARYTAIVIMNAVVVIIRFISIIMARIVGKTVGKSISSSGIAFTSDSKKIIDVVKMYMTGLNYLHF